MRPKRTYRRGSREALLSGGCGRAGARPRCGPQALAGAPVPVVPPFGGTAKVWGPHPAPPPRRRWAAADRARRPCLCLGLAPGQGPWAWRPAGPGSGPSAALRRAPGALRPTGGPSPPSARGGFSPGGPRCGVAVAGPPAGSPRRWPRPPPRGVWAGRLLSLAALRALRSCRRSACAPSLVAPVPPLPPPLGRPGYALGRRASSPRGAAVGGCAARLRPPPPALEGPQGAALGILSIVVADGEGHKARGGASFHCGSGGRGKEKTTR